MSIQSENALKSAHSLIETCRIEEAADLLENVLVSDLEDLNLVFAIQCCNFWKNTLSSLSMYSYYEQGELLLIQWKPFLSLIEKKQSPLERTVYAFKKGIFSLALEAYLSCPEEKDVKLKADILKKIGMCYKKLGSYEIALRHLTEANSCLQGQASILAEMADCYALCGETKNAKMLFREAFYINAQQIDLVFLDSPLIRVLIEKVMDKGYTGEPLQEWVSVYGVLYGIFNVKRQLRAQEHLRLKQEVYARENEIKDPANNRAVLTPRLLNLYFWLIDFYEVTKDDVEKIKEVVLKIRLLDPEIYQLYIK